MTVTGEHFILLNETINFHTHVFLNKSRAIQIDSEGRLVVEKASDVQTLSSGEVNIQKQ